MERWKSDRTWLEQSIKDCLQGEACAAERPSGWWQRAVDRACGGLQEHSNSFLARASRWQNTAQPRRGPPSYLRLPVSRRADLAVMVSMVALITILVMVVVPLWRPPGMPQSATEIALADPQVRTTFTPEEMRSLSVQEVAGGERQTIVILSTNSGAMVMVGVDMTARKVSQWLFGSVAASASPYQLIFDSDKNGLQSIFVVNADGSRLTKLTDNRARYYMPSWSQASQAIAFVANLTGYNELYTMNANGTGIKQLTNLPQVLHPAWSPDGSALVFSSSNSGHYELYRIGADGTGLTRLTTSMANQFNPAWSPDGRKIAFSSNRDGNWEVYVMDADGGNQLNLTGNVSDESSFSWSPDSRRLAFSSARGGSSAIYLVNADGTDLIRVENGLTASYIPIWSPDGARLAFYSRDDGDAEIYVMDVDGTDVRKLTDNDVSDSVPSWSPDGKQLAYHSRNGNGYSLYVVSLDDLRYTELAFGSIGNIYAWAKLDSYPNPTVSQDVTLIPLPLTATPVTTAVVGSGPPTMRPDNPTMIPPPVSVWPVQKAQAIALAESYLPPGVLNQANVKAMAGWGWSGPGWGVGEPRWYVRFTGISVTRAELGWAPQHNLTQTDGAWSLLLPVISLQGEGPYIEVDITISGVDGELRSAYALMKPLVATVMGGPKTG